MLIVWIAIFGALGTVARYGISRTIPAFGEFPWATLLVNLLGSFCIGWVAGPSLSGGAALSQKSVVAMVGFLGGFTTFSAFSFETVRLFSQGRAVTALVYAAATPVLCIGLAAAGSFASSR